MAKEVLVSYKTFLRRRHQYSLALVKYLVKYLAKYLTCCVANLTHMLHIKFQPSSCSSCFKQYFPFPPGGKIIHNYFMPVLIILLNPAITSSRCVEDTPGYTLVHLLVHDKYSSACWVSRKLRPKVKQFRIYRGLLQVVLFTDRRYNILSECVWFCNVTPELSRNRHCANRTTWLEFKTDFQSVLRTLETLFTTFVLFHARRHKM